MASLELANKIPEGLNKLMSEKKIPEYRVSIKFNSSLF
jgi:hypothetical protein